LGSEERTGGEGTAWHQAKGLAKGAAQLKVPLTIREAYRLGLKHGLKGHAKMVSLSFEMQAAYDAGFEKGRAELPTNSRTQKP